MYHSLAVLSLLAFAGAAQAQHFVNADFETGDLSGWTITPTPNGVTLIQVVEIVDIDGPGPLDPALAAKFAVGQVVFTSGEQEGIEITQDLNLTAGVQYDFGFNWAATRPSGGNNADGGVFSLIVDGVALDTHSSGTVSSEESKFGRIDVQFTPTTTGQHTVGARITRRFLNPGDVFQYVDNFTPGGPPTPVCYADCDGNETLTVDDFTCFINEFASATTLPHEQQVEHYANCDGSTSMPALTVDDFTCFINEFAQGCP